jgi:hypothetical protein
MAKNLRAKIPASDTLIIRDVNKDAMTRFVEESQEIARSSGAGAEVGQVEVAENAREVAEKSVRICLSLLNLSQRGLDRANQMLYSIDCDDHKSPRISACHRSVQFHHETRKSSGS